MVAKFNPIPLLDPVILRVLAPSEIDRVLELFELKVVQLTANPALLNDPFVIVIDEVAVNALVSVQPPPTPSKTTSPIRDTPPVLIVLPVAVELNVVTFVAPGFHTVPATNDIEPLITGALLLKVTGPAETVMF
jgi:hypothetical protein